MSEYTFFVVASDGGQDTVRSSSAKVTVLITDANDHTPGIDNIQTLFSIEFKTQNMRMVPEIPF